MKREEKLQHTLWEIEKKWGQGTIHSAASGTPRRAVSTGFDTLDDALQSGGALTGQITVLMGIPTSGATTCAYRTIAKAQAQAGAAAYLDFGASFDPDMAVRFGIVLPHLLLVRTEQIDDGLQVGRDIVSANAAALLVVDLSGCATALSRQTYERLADVALRSDCAVLVVIDRDDASLKSIAHTWLTFERQTWLKNGERVCGCHTHVLVKKDKPTIKIAVVPLDITFGETVD